MGGLREIKTATLLLLGSIGAAHAANLSGQASIIDGDTLEIHGTRCARLAAVFQR